MKVPVKQTTTQHKIAQKAHPQAVLCKLQTKFWLVMMTLVMNTKTAKMMKRRPGKPVLKMKVGTK